MGVCAALALARRGARVVVLERGPELAWGCSAGNAGLICPSHAAPLATPAALKQGIRWMLRPDSPLYLRPRPAAVPWLARYLVASTPAKARRGTRVIRDLARAGLVQHARLAESGVETGFETRGGLYVFETEHALAAARDDAAEAVTAGLRADVLTPDEAVELEPALGFRPVGAISYPDDGQCEPRRFVHAVGAAAGELGAEIRTRTEVLALRTRDGAIDAVATTAGDLRAGTVVVAGGAWTPHILRGTGLFVPVEGGKGYHVDYERGSGDPVLPVHLEAARVIATPFADRIRLAGTLELAGLDLGVDPRRVNAIVRAGLRGLPGLEGRRVLEVWRGLRPCTPDGLPAIGRPEAYDNLVLATGHAMMGLALAPATGELVAQVVSGEAPSHDLAPFDPDRFRPLLGRD